MSCFDPIHGWRSKDRNPSGKRSIVFRRSEALVDFPITIPCGKCDGCMISSAREWAVRCVGEASLYKDNCFVTLTYREEDLPDDGSINKEAVSGFMKLLRQEIVRKAEKAKKKPPIVRFFACGEYGSKMGRPHYHLAIFNYDFEDKELWRLSVDDDPLYRSATLEKLWNKGFCTLGTITARSANYIARYMQKKIAGKNDEKRYWINSDDEVKGGYELEREFGLMSRRPGIGKDWFEKFMNDCRKDFLVVEGSKHPVPRYYRNMLELYDKKVSDKNKRNRKRIREKQEAKGEFTRDRLDQQEQILKQRLGRLRRSAEAQ